MLSLMQGQRFRIGSFMIVLVNEDLHEEDHLNECYCVLKEKYKWEDL